MDYAAYVLDQRREGVFKTNLTPWSDGIRVRTQTPFRTPWRTVQVAPDAASLLNEQVALMSYRLQVIQHIDELSAVDRQAFENHVRGSYEVSRAGRLFYETFIRPTQHPDVVRYIDGVLAKSP